MSNVNKQIKVIIGLMVVWSSAAWSFQSGRSFFLARPQGGHAERELVGNWAQSVNLQPYCENYASFAFYPVYSRSIRSSHIVEYFFGCSQPIVVSGAKVPGRGDLDVLADYFGLPQDFKSTVQFNPLVQNISANIDLYIGLDEFWSGSYFRMLMPFVQTSWGMRIAECVQDFGSLPYVPGYMANQGLLRADLVADVTSWFAGNRIVGDLHPLKFGLIDGMRSESGLADLQMVLGWNPVLTERYHFGFNGRVTIPTGNSSKGVYFFEPMIGNGRHWECGVGLTGHSWMFESENGCHNLFVYGDANLTHLFGSCQKRSFDFKRNGAGSRYILIEEIGVPLVQGLLFNGFDADSPALTQYHGSVIPAINQTTLNVHVSVALQADIALMFTYRYDQFSVDVGYDFWGRTGEKFHYREPFPENSFAVKGDALLYGFATTTNQFIALNATQSQATMHAGQGAGNDDFLNANADNASIIGFEFDANPVDLGLSGDSATRVNGSDPSILITDCDIDNLSALAPAAIAHTFFAHVDYRWDTCSRVEPSLGFGAEISVDGTGARRKTALSEWSVWMKICIAS
jgi:hypothetical protein